MKGLAQEVSEEKNSKMCYRDHSYYIGLRKMTTFCPCLKNLSENKVKSFGNIPLAKKNIPNQPSIDTVMCLLVVNIMKIYSEKKHVEQGNKYIKCRTISEEKEYQEME